MEFNLISWIDLV